MMPSLENLQIEEPSSGFKRKLPIIIVVGMAVFQEKAGVGWKTKAGVGWKTRTFEKVYENVTCYYKGGYREARNNGNCVRYPNIFVPFISLPRHQGAKTWPRTEDPRHSQVPGNQGVGKRRGT